MFRQETRQAVKNIFCLHDLRETLDEERLQLFLALPILDHSGFPCCMHHDIEYYASEHGWLRCPRPLKDTLRLCHAFEIFYLTAGDRLMKDEDDPEMVHQLVNFLLYACCEEHEGNFPEPEALAWRLLDDVKIWRRKHLFRIPDPPTVEQPDSPESLDSQPSRISRLLGRADPLGSFRVRENDRSVRSVSPANARDDSNSTLKQNVRPDSSASDLVPRDRRTSLAERGSVEVNRHGQEMGNGGSGRKRDRFGFSMVTTKLTLRR